MKKPRLAIIELLSLGKINFSYLLWDVEPEVSDCGDPDGEQLLDELEALVPVWDLRWKDRGPTACATSGCLRKRHLNFVFPEILKISFSFEKFQIWKGLSSSRSRRTRGKTWLGFNRNLKNRINRKVDKKECCIATCDWMFEYECVLSFLSFWQKVKTFFK